MSPPRSPVALNPSRVANGGLVWAIGWVGWLEVVEVKTAGVLVYFVFEGGCRGVGRGCRVRRILGGACGTKVALIVVLELIDVVQFPNLAQEAKYVYLVGVLFYGFVRAGYVELNGSVGTGRLAVGFDLSTSKVAKFFKVVADFIIRSAGELEDSAGACFGVVGREVAVPPGGLVLVAWIAGGSGAKLGAVGGVVCHCAGDGGGERSESDCAGCRGANDSD